MGKENEGARDKENGIKNGEEEKEKDQKRKKKRTERNKETSEEEVRSNGERGEPKGIIAPALEGMTSAVFG